MGTVVYETETMDEIYAEIDATELNSDEYMINDKIDKAEALPDFSEPVETVPATWTSAQCEYWKKTIEERHWCTKLQSDAARHWFRRVFRPKKRVQSGSDRYLMERDRVRLGSAEDYILEHVQSVFDPWGSARSTAMRSLSGAGELETDVADEIIDDMIQARFRTMGKERQEDLLRASDRVSSLYGFD